MKLIRNFLRLCTFSVINAFLVSGLLLSEAQCSTGPEVASIIKTTEKIEDEFKVNISPTPFDNLSYGTKGNNLYCAGEVYESGADLSNYASIFNDVTSETFDAENEIYQLENEVTMAHILLGRGLGNDFIGLIKFNGMSDSDIGLISCDTAHYSPECIKLFKAKIDGGISEALANFSTKYKLEPSYTSIAELTTSIKECYNSQLELYQLFANHLHQLYSPKATWRVKGWFTKESDKTLETQDSSTHTEIMILYRILEKCGVVKEWRNKINSTDKIQSLRNNIRKYRQSIVEPRKLDAERKQLWDNQHEIIVELQKAVDLNELLTEKAEDIKKLLPKTIFSYKGMCDTCDFTLAGFYKKLYGSDGGQKTMFVGKIHVAQHRGEEISGLASCELKIYKPASLAGQSDAKYYMNHLSALHKRLTQIDNLLESSTTEDATTEDQKEILIKNKYIIIQKCIQIIRTINQAEPEPKKGEEQGIALINNLLTYSEQFLNSAGPITTNEIINTDYDKTFDYLGSYIRDLPIGMQHLAQEAKTLKDKLACLIQSNLSNAKEYKDVKNQKSFRNMLKEVQTPFDDFANSLTALQKQITSLGPTQQILNFNSAFDKFKREIDGLKTAIDNFNSTPDKFKGEIDDPKTEITNIDNVNNPAKEELQKLFSELKKIMGIEGIDDSEWNYDALDNSIKKLTTQLNRITLPAIVLNDCIKQIKDSTGTKSGPKTS